MSDENIQDLEVEETDQETVSGGAGIEYGLVEADVSPSVAKDLASGKLPTNIKPPTV